MTKWELIFVCGIFSYLLRSLPFLIFHKIKLREDGYASKFFIYASYSVLGGIVYSSVYGETFYENWSGHFEVNELLKIMVLCLAFFIAIWSKSTIKTLLLCLSIYGALSFFNFST